MQSSEVLASRDRAGWSNLMARLAGAILLFELVSGLAITLGPFRPATEWGLLLHTIAGVVTMAPLAWYLVRHWKDYSDQALSDVLLLGYVGIGALAICLVSGLLVTWQAVLGVKTLPWLRYIHLISTLLTVAAAVPHILIAWWRRRRAETSRGAAGWLGAGAAVTIAGVGLVIALTLAYSGTKYRNTFPADVTKVIVLDDPLR